MRKALRIFFRIVFSRTLITIVLLSVQILLLFGTFFWFGAFLPYLFSGFILASAALIIYIINKEGNPAFKLAWILPVCLVPVVGGLLYLFIAVNPGNFGLKKEIKRTQEETASFLKTTSQIRKMLESEDAHFQHISNYLERKGGFATYSNTEVAYYSLGEEKYEALKASLKQAEHFIFLEYFIIERGEMWNSILEILEEKAREGVEVRVMYDGMCSLILLPYSYPARLREKGIRAKMFSPIKPALSTHQNNRDHRKIVVIDGKVAFSGGVNLADEYINRIHPFGHWKDVAVRLEGEAVKGFTAMFLQMWNVGERKKEDYGKYLNVKPEEKETGGFVIPYGDGSTNRENVAENIYMDMLYTAKEYVYIMTPYLIIDNEMLTALTYAAARGVNVKLILPHVPDKKSAFAIARTFYPQLLRAGVEIYEYTPGFVHAKVFLSDGCKAVVGTINLDFRSLYLHFECAAYLYCHPAIESIRKDFDNMLAQSGRIGMEDYRRIGFLSRLTGYVFRLVAPLM